jgi:hypothetical protein
VQATNRYGIDDDDEDDEGCLERCWVVFDMEEEKEEDVVVVVVLVEVVVFVVVIVCLDGISDRLHKGRFSHRPASSISGRIGLIPPKVCVKSKVLDNCDGCCCGCRCPVCSGVSKNVFLGGVLIGIKSKYKAGVSLSCGTA